MRRKELRTRITMDIKDMSVEVVIDAIADNEQVDTPNDEPLANQRSYDIECITFNKDLYSKQEVSDIESYLLCSPKARAIMIEKLEQADSETN